MKNTRLWDGLKEAAKGGGVELVVMNAPKGGPKLFTVERQYGPGPRFISGAPLVEHQLHDLQRAGVTVKQLSDGKVTTWDAPAPLKEYKPAPAQPASFRASAAKPQTYVLDKAKVDRFIAGLAAAFNRAKGH